MTRRRGARWLPIVARALAAFSSLAVATSCVRSSGAPGPTPPPTAVDAKIVRVSLGASSRPVIGATGSWRIVDRTGAELARGDSGQRLRAIRAELEELDAACVFAEPQFRPALVETLVEGTGARTGVLDPLGADLEAGPGQYAQLLRALSASLVDCLGTPRSG